MCQSHFSSINVVFILGFVFIAACRTLAFRQSYLKYDDLNSYLHELEASYTDLLKLYSLGKSPGGREIWALHITNSQWPTKEKKPKVKLEGSSEGDDAVGREILLRLASHLLENFGKEENISRIVNEMSIYIVPSYDPDGFENARESCDEPTAKSTRGNWLLMKFIIYHPLIKLSTYQLASTNWFHLLIIRREYWSVSPTSWILWPLIDPSRRGNKSVGAKLLDQRSRHQSWSIFFSKFSEAQWTHEDGYNLCSYIECHFKNA